MFFIACPLCKPYNAPFQELYEDLGEGNEDVQFFLLTTRSNDSNEEVKDYKNQYNLTFPGAGDDGGGYRQPDGAGAEGRLAVHKPTLGAPKIR